VRSTFVDAKEHRHRSISKLAFVIGASSRIGLDLADCSAAAGYDLLLVDEEPRIEQTAIALRRRGTVVDAVQANLATSEGRDALYAAARGRPVDALLTSATEVAGPDLVHARWPDAQCVIDANVSGRLALIQRVGHDMRGRGIGNILVTDPAPEQASSGAPSLRHGTRSLLDSFLRALRAELAGSGASVTHWRPRAAQTDVLDRAAMLETMRGWMRHP